MVSSSRWVRIHWSDSTPRMFRSCVPMALTGGPAGAALTAGNTVVIKPATDTAWIVRLYAECFRDAGFPEGVVNFVTGPGSTLGQALVDSPELDGATFTGSFDVGMKLFR